MKQEKENVQNNTLAFLKGRETVVNAFKSGIFSMPSKKLEGEPDYFFPSEIYERISASESPT